MNAPERVRNVKIPFHFPQIPITNLASPLGCRVDSGRFVMRVLLVIFALLLLPVLALLHRYHFTRTMQGQLLVQVMGALDDPELVHVKSDPGTTMNHLDVILSGTVADIVWRDRARTKVNAIRGIRCREEDNHIHVPAGIEGKLEGDVMHLKGWLRDDATLREITLWLTEGRPGLKMDTANVRISPYVSAEESPRRAKSPLFQPLWSLIEVPARLDIIKRGNSLKVTGQLPSQELKQSVVEAIIGIKVETTLDDREVKTGAYVKSAPFASKPVELAALLKVLFDSQESIDFHADPETISFNAEVTDEQHGRWQPLLAALGGEKMISPTWTFRPSIYHLSTYKPVSNLPVDTLQKLKAALEQGVVRFPPTSSAVTPEQIVALNPCAQAILAAYTASPDIRIIVGAHPETGGDSKGSQLLARRRAEAVVEQFVDRALPMRIFEIVPYAPPHAGDPAGATRSHTVEMFVK